MLGEAESALTGGQRGNGGDGGEQGEVVGAGELVGNKGMGWEGEV